MKNLKAMLKGFIQLSLLLLLIQFASCKDPHVFNIEDYGAIGDGKTMNTIAIQKAIDACSESGGKVLIPEGIFLSGTIHMKNEVNIHILKGGILKGSPFFKDYPDNEVKYKNAFTHFEDGKPYPNKALIFAEGLKNIAFTGDGTIDGSGDSKEFNLGNDVTPASRSRPCMLLIIDSQLITVSDLYLTNSAYWLQNYLGCKDLKLTGLKIFNQSNYNQDGMDIDAKNVLIENCKIDVDDDAICFKSHDRNRLVENVVVKNCTIASNCNAIKFGTTSIGGFKNIKISKCIINKASEDHIRQWQKNLKFIDQPTTVISGVALEAVDGGIIEDIEISDIKMNDVQTPIFIRLADRNRKHVLSNAQPASIIRNIRVENIVATSHSKMSSSITGYPGHYVENVTLKNININGMGEGTKSESETVLEENSKSYPENRMYGLVYPSSGLYIRHVKNIKCDNLNFSYRKDDFRPDMLFDDVYNSDIIGFKAPTPMNGDFNIKLVNCKSITVFTTKSLAKSNSFIKLDGTTENELKLIEKN